MALNVIKKYLTNNDCYKAAGSIIPVGMQLHTIGTAQNDSSALASYWNQPGVGACVHYCIDAATENTVLQFLPDNYRSWADGGWGNASAITVELMESKYMSYTGGADYLITDEAKFKADITRAYNTAVQFFAQKCTEYGWNPTDKLGNGLYRISSHNEGRLAGLSTAHVDPDHIWKKFGFTMDKFRQDVANAMKGNVQVVDVDAVSSAAVNTPLYRVRIKWEDSDGQIFAGTLDGAKKVVEKYPEYKVFDKDGNQVYPVIEESRKVIDKVWLGWTKRESGSAGFRQTNGDAGKAYGKYQFDYRYALVPFMQYCLTANPEHYKPFAAFIGYGAANNGLINNEALAMTWEEICIDYPKEFEALQDAYAYSHYYLEAKRYISKIYGIDMDNHSPAVKGSLFSMAIRSGALMAAYKFSDCNDETPDDELLFSSYEKYGAEDANRWTQAGQLGDALKALENNEFTPIYGLSNIADAATNQIIYRVQVGVYGLYDNANRMLARLKASGIDGIITKESGDHIVQAGLFESEENANKLAEEIKEAGLPVAVKKILR